MKKKFLQNQEKIIRAENFLDDILTSEFKQEYLERILNYEKFSKVDSIIDKIVLGLISVSVPYCTFQTLTAPSSFSVPVTFIVSSVAAAYLAYSYKTRHIKSIINHCESENIISLEIKKEDNIENLNEDLHMYLDNQKGTQDNLYPLNKREFSEVVKYIKTNYAEDIKKFQGKNKSKGKFLVNEAIEKLDGLKNNLFKLKDVILENKLFAGKENNKSNITSKTVELEREM